MSWNFKCSHRSAASPSRPVMPRALLLIASLAVLTMSAAAREQCGMKPRAKAMYEALLRRPVTNAELDRVYAEIADKPGQCEADRLRELDEAIATLHRQHGRPAALHLRHSIAEYAFFDRTTPFGSKLALSFDPVVISDPSDEEIMTQSDLHGFVQLLKFAWTDVDPRQIESQKAMDAKLVSGVRAELKSMIDQGGHLSELPLNASAFWAGLVQHWGSLKAQEKSAVRNYIARSIEGQLSELPDALYARLMGWSGTDIKLANLNKTIAVGRMWQGTYAHMQNLKALHDTVSTATHNSDGSFRLK